MYNLQLKIKFYSYNMKNYHKIYLMINFHLIDNSIYFYTKIIKPLIFNTLYAIF